MALANLQRGFAAQSSDHAQVTVVSEMHIHCMCMHSIGDNQLGYTFVCVKNKLRPKWYLQEHKLETD